MLCFLWIHLEIAVTVSLITVFTSFFSTMQTHCFCLLIWFCYCCYRIWLCITNRPTVMSLSRWYFRFSQLAKSSVFLGYKLTVYFRNLTSQLIADLQEKVIALLEENQTFRKWKETKVEGLKFLWEGNRDMITAFQDKNMAAWEKNMALWKKKHELLGQCQHSTNGWNWSLGKGPSPMEGWDGPLEEGTGPLERGTRISWRLKTFTEENTILLARNQRWCTCMLKMISAFLS